MKFSEKEHAAVLIAYYEGFIKALGEESGRAAFLLAERQYGERRGRRMAQRALRDGFPLDFTSYFAYGELITTPGGYEGSYEASEGLVHEVQHKCPWASAFREQGGMACARLYCSEIDAAVVRGFNCLLDYRYGGNMHEQGCCVFDFRSPELDGGSLGSGARKTPEGCVNKYDMAWHTADVYQVFKRVCENVCPKAADAVSEVLRNKLGDEAFEFLEKLSEEDHDSIDQTC